MLFWSMLLIVGQAASLALVQAGNLVGYQHYGLGAGGIRVWAAIAVLAVQASFVVVGLRDVWSAIRDWLRRELSPLSRGLLVVAIVICSATVSKSPAFYVSELGAATVIQLIAIGNVVAIARSTSAGPAAAWLRGLFGPLGDGAPARHGDRFALVCALWVFVAASFLALFAYQRHPHVPDEVVYLLHARYFAEGMVTMPLPRAPLAFNVDIMHYGDTRWWSPVPPGWPFVLAIGVKLGAPWLVNPVLGALNVWLAHAVLRSMYEQRVARLATVFLATSPWFVFMSMNFMTHQLTLCLALAGALAVARLRADREGGGPVRASTMGWLLAGGVAIGVASLVRPLEGLAIAVLLGVWSLPPRWWGYLTSPSRYPALAPSALLAAGTAASGALTLPYNRVITGDPGYFPIMAYIDKHYARGSNDMGFGANRGLGWTGLDPFPGHGPLDVIVNANLNITTTNVELLGWMTGSLLAAFLLFALRRARRPDWWHAGVIIFIAGIHSFYWFSGGPDFGARYWYLMVVSCIALVARGVVEVGNRVPVRDASPAAREEAQGRVIAGALALTVAAVLTFFPWRAVDKYYHYRNMHPDVRTLARAHGFGRSLVLVRGRRHPDYASATAYNPLDLEADAPLYAWDATPEARAQALRAYPDRPVYFLDGPTITGNGYRVAAGPLTAEEAQSYRAP